MSIRAVSMLARTWNDMEEDMEEDMEQSMEVKSCQHGVFVD